MLTITRIYNKIYIFWRCSKINFSYLTERALFIEFLNNFYNISFIKDHTYILYSVICGNAIKINVLIFFPTNWSFILSIKSLFFSKTKESLNKKFNELKFDWCINPNSIAYRLHSNLIVFITLTIRVNHLYQCNHVGHLATVSSCCWTTHYYDNLRFFSFLFTLMFVHVAGQFQVSFTCMSYDLMLILLGLSQKVVFPIHDFRCHALQA